VQRDELGKVIEFLELLQHNEKNLIKVVKTEKGKWPEHYWRILMKVKTPARPYAVMQNSQKVIMDLLKSKSS